MPGARLLSKSHRHGREGWEKREARETRGKKKEKESTTDAGSLPGACYQDVIRILNSSSRSLGLSLAGVWFLRVRAGPGSPHGIKDFGLGWIREARAPVSEIRALPVSARARFPVRVCPCMGRDRIP